MTIAALIARAPAEVPVLFAQAQKPMGIDLSGPNLLVAQVFAFLVGVIAIVALWKAIVNGKPKLLFGLFGCVLVAGLIFRFRDVGKIDDNDVYTGIEGIAGIEEEAPPAAPPVAPPATR